ITVMKRWYLRIVLPRVTEIITVMKQRYLKIVVPLVIGVITVGIVSLLGVTRPDVASPTVLEQVKNVRAITARYGSATPTLVLYGKVFAGQQAEMRAHVSGEIVKAWPAFQEGAIISKGEPLLRIDPFVYESALSEAKANFAEMQAKVSEVHHRREQEGNALTQVEEQLEIAKRDLARAVELSQRGTVSEKLVDERRLRVSQQQQASDRHRHNLDIEDARIEQQKAIAERLAVRVRRAERVLENTLLVAPFSGFLQDLRGAVGQLVSINDRLAIITDADRLEVRFSLSDAQYGRLIAEGNTLVGEKAEVVWRASSQPLPYEAIIDRVAASITASTGSVDVFATLQQMSAQTPLRPGAFVEVYIKDKIYEDVVRLPESALYEGNVVYAIVNGRLEPRQIEIAGYDNDSILVRGTVKEGERILTTHLTQVGAGVKVKIL
ncbi:MAG: efflux RND transporter periplasmic adaptor subunit, partial [Parvularculales bacterium]